MIWQAFVFAAGFAGGGALPVQPATTQLDAVAGIQDVDTTTQTEDVQFQTGRDDRLTVPVRLSGSGPYRFLVDTGADRTAVSRELAGKLGLAGGQRASLASITGISSVSTADLRDLQFTRRTVDIDDAPLLNSADMGADGILGVDSLRSQRVMFDFEGQTMSIVPSAVPDFRDEPGTIVVRTKRRHGRLVVTDAAAEGHSITVVLDTGAEVSIGNEALRQELAGKGLIDAGQKVDLLSVTGQTISGDYMLLRQIEIGGLVLRNVAVVFADAHTFKQLKLVRKPALLLGMNAISAFKKVSIDFANRKFRVVLPEESALMFELADARRQ
jgi:predicted aspartyl protease